MSKDRMEIPTDLIERSSDWEALFETAMSLEEDGPSVYVEELQERVLELAGIEDPTEAERRAAGVYADYTYEYVNVTRVYWLRNMDNLVEQKLSLGRRSPFGSNQWHPKRERMVTGETPAIISRERDVRREDAGEIAEDAEELVRHDEEVLEAYEEATSKDAAS